MQGKRPQQLRRVPSNRRVALAYPVEEVEVFRLRELLRLCDACGKIFPGDDAFNRGEGIAAALLGFKQNLANSAVKPELLIDRLAIGLKLLLMLMLCGVEQLANDPVMKADDSSVMVAMPSIDSATKVAYRRSRSNFIKSPEVIWPPSRAIFKSRF